MKFQGWVQTLLLSAIVALAGCSSKFLKVEDPKDLAVDQEFEQQVKIETPQEETTETPPMAPIPEVKNEAPVAPAAKAPVKKAPPPKKPAKKTPPPPPLVKKTTKAAAKKGVPERREPDIESDVGFKGRRPLVDPFWVGEEVVHDVSYFKISAGELTLKVDPFAQVNGRKAYQFVTAIKTYERFSSYVYAVDDRVVTLVDFEELVPRAFTLHVKESSQVREARSYFDFEKLKATFWEKKVTKKNGAEEKKQSWDILPYSQNVFSAAFYMRVFAWEVGKEYAFRVADDGDNMVFKGTALRKEVLQTKLGPMNAIVVRPVITTKGVFKPMGEILIWLSDDDRKHILRIESKIKIGTLVSEIVRLNPGKKPTP